ncbi:MAG: hypothetical protein ABF304_00905 [Flavobacteriaceae bacterium]|jgi:hypothetical protein|nr:hypothetical protein [Flavobacteriaceae bacterium LSUCC0859]
MKKELLSLLVLLAMACAKKTTVQDIHLLNGYWEISEVSFPNGQNKTYGVNTSIDYIEINELEGYLKKMKPGLNGRYTTNNSTLYFTATNQNNQWELGFKDAQSQRLKIIQLDSNSYTAVNEKNIKYLYKRYFPIDISYE